MSEVNQDFTTFVATVNEEAKIWALQNADGDWVVCDSAEFERADVMPIWSNAETAKQFCVDEWHDYNAASIMLEEFLEEWIADLNEDGVLLGVEWQIQGECAELDAIEVAKLIVDA